MKLQSAKPRRHRLSGRLVLLFLLMALLLALVVRSGFRYGLEGGFRDLARPHLAEYVQHLLDQLGNPPSPERASLLEERLPIRVVLRSGDSREPEARSASFESRWLFSRTLPDGTIVDVLRGAEGFALRTQRGETTVLFLSPFPEAGEFAPLAVVLTIAGVLAIVAFGYHAIRRMIRPVETIRDGVTRIGAGELSHRLAIDRRDELGDLAASINGMADKIQDMLEAKRQLLLAVSHELRSPLTRARIHAELIEDESIRPDLLANLAELETLLGELLESERLRGGHTALAREAVDPTELLSELVESTFPNAGIALKLDPPGTWLPLDPVRIRLLARNLLSNAVRHTPPDASPPSLSSHVDDTGWTLKVKDHGTGIAAEHLHRLTEPFFRADASRQRGSGGVGLGLYLCRTIAEAHGGRIEIDSATGAGTEVRARIPFLEAGPHKG